MQAAVIIAVALYVIFVIAHWKIFTKAGQKGWTSIIPFLNIFVLMKIVKRPMWWAVIISLGIILGNSLSDAASGLQIVGGLLGIAAAILFILSLFSLAKAFGHGILFGLCLVLFNFIFALILGFGKSTYQLEPDPLL